MLRQYLDGQCDYDSIRQYIFSRYESEGEILVDDSADELLSVLGPYVEFEEAFGDDCRDVRLRRLVVLLETAHESLSNVAAFAMNYDEIQTLLQKQMAGAVSEFVLRQQVQKMSPAELDVGLLLSWGRSHQGQSEPIPNTM